MSAPVHCFAHEAMATVFEVRCAHDDARYARQAAEAAFALLDGLEQALSRFVPNSDVARINGLRAGESTRVGPSTMEVLRIARGIFERTGGAFDVALGTGLESLELAPEDATVHARAGGVRLDLGGIGKGYAVDCMAERLFDWGVERALVHGGRSSVRALRPPPDESGWPLTFSAPGDDGRVVARLSAHAVAVSASGTRKRGHIVDPRTALAARTRAAWAVLSGVAEPEPDGVDGAAERPAAVAEGLSTAFMLLSPDAVRDLCRRIGGLDAWVVPDPDDGAWIERSIPPGPKLRIIRP